ncbi:MAG TPA: sigma factor-like helix-turn-helix DNA-binding protein [Candidatus Dormibacteraeota bacterium]|nr:sigma factor-like helix-turn-helix DNA-binding protein [Candidatus Dormibacteraeota bacterium]
MTSSVHASVAGAPGTPVRDATGDPAADLVRRQRLLDVYGALLTEHQREACRLRLDEDWTYAELAVAFGVSRSGAYDLVRRALTQLAHLESRLGHAAELARRDAVEARLRARIARLDGSVEVRA